MSGIRGILSGPFRALVNNVHAQDVNRGVQAGLTVKSRPYYLNQLPISPHNFSRVDLNSQIIKLRTEHLGILAQAKYQAFENHITILERDLILAKRVSFMETVHVFKNVVITAFAFGFGLAGLGFSVVHLRNEHSEVFDRTSLYNTTSNGT